MSETENTNPQAEEKKDDLMSKAKEVADKAEDFIEDSVEKIKNSGTFGKIAGFFDKVEDFIDEKVDQVKESGIIDKIEDYAEKAEDKAEAAFKKAKEAGTIISSKFKEAVDEIKTDKTEVPVAPVAQAEQPAPEATTEQPATPPQEPVV